MKPRMFGRGVRRVVHFLGTLLMVAAMVVFAHPQGTARAAPAIPAMISANHAAALAEPAVVRIITDVSGQITARIQGEDTALPEVPKGLVGFSGSGAFISPDGFVLTADHVVEGTTDDNRASLRMATAYLLSQQGDYTMSEWSDYLDRLDSEGALQYKVLTSPTVYLSTEYLGPSLQHVTRLPVTRIVASSPFFSESDNKGQDVAIVQVQANDMPYVTLAPSADISSPVTALGFPGDADVNSDFLGVLEAAAPDLTSATGLLTPSESGGTIQAEKPMPNGTMIYETAGISFPGSSGGPLIDNQGRVVGIASFTTSSTGRIGGWIASSVLAMYVPSHQASGPLMAKWTTAMNDFYATSAGHWGKAANDLRAIRTDYPDFGGVTPYLDQAQTKATTEPKVAPTSKGGFPMALVIAGVVLALLIAGGVFGFLFMNRRRGKGQAAAPVAPPTIPAQPFGAPQLMAQSPTEAPMYEPPVSQPYTSQPVTLAPVAQPPTETPVYGAVQIAQTLTPPPISQPVTLAPIAQTPSAAAPALGPTPSVQPITASPIAQPFSAPEIPTTVGLASGVQHVCMNGHMVLDPAAHFCPACGAEVKIMAHA